MLPFDSLEKKVNEVLSHETAQNYAFRQKHL